VQSIEDKLLTSLAEKFGGRPQLSDELVLIGVDSVGMAELTIEIEKDYGIRVEDDILNVETVQQLADYIRQRLSPSQRESFE
jgi:acyl carrier protein